MARPAASLAMVTAANLVGRAGSLADFDAILSDLDGVLVDSDAAIGRGYDEWADGHGLDRALVRSLYPGTPARQVVEQAAPWLDAGGGGRAHRPHPRGPRLRRPRAARRGRAAGRSARCRCPS